MASKESACEAGWRWLAVGEQINVGDQFMLGDDAIPIKSYEAGGGVAPAWRECYRRRVEPAEPAKETLPAISPGWRAMTAGEYTTINDDYWDDFREDWRPAQEGQLLTKLNHCFYRRRVTEPTSVEKPAAVKSSPETCEWRGLKWRPLQINEVVQAGDQCKQEWGDWRPVNDTIGFAVTQEDVEVGRFRRNRQAQVSVGEMLVQRLKKLCDSFELPTPTPRPQPAFADPLREEIDVLNERITQLAEDRATAYAELTRLKTETLRLRKEIVEPAVRLLRELHYTQEADDLQTLIEEG